MKLDQEPSRLWAACRAIAPIVAVAAIAALVANAADARASAAPTNTTAPAVTGTPTEGGTLTTDNGTWANSPTTFTVQWQRCDAGGASCADISGATSKSYTVATADVDHTLRSVVTATNADGNNSASSKATAVVSSAKAPVNTALPAISGTDQAGQELSASNGAWTGGVSSYSFYWERCNSAGASCAPVAGASGRTYGVRSNDAGSTLRVVVRARNASGSTSATSAATAVVTAAGGTPAPPAAKNHAPTISYISLRRVGNRIYARFRVCDDSAKAITVSETDTKAHTAAYTRRFSVVALPCATYSKNWLLIARFRHGRYTASLRAIDKSGAASRTVSRTLNHS